MEWFLLYADKHPVFFAIFINLLLIGVLTVLWNLYIQPYLRRSENKSVGKKEGR